MGSEQGSQDWQEKLPESKIVPEYDHEDIP